MLDSNPNPNSNPNLSANPYLKPNPNPNSNPYPYVRELTLGQWTLILCEGDNSSSNPIPKTVYLLSPRELILGLRKLTICEEANPYLKTVYMIGSRELTLYLRKLRLI